MTDRLLDGISNVVSSKVWVLGTMAATIIFMAWQFFSPRPIDDPKAFFPMVVLVYTLFSLWIENIMKAQQRNQQQAQERQMEMMSELLRQVKEQGVVTHHLVELVVSTVDKVLKAVQLPDPQTIRSLSMIADAKQKLDAAIIPPLKPMPVKRPKK